MKKTIIILSMLLGISPAIADSVNKSMQATAKINAFCEISAGNVSFGEISGSGAQEYSSNLAIKARCTNGTAYKLLLPTPSRSIFLDGVTASPNKIDFVICKPGTICDTKLANNVWISTLNAVASIHNVTGTGLEQTFNSSVVLKNGYYKVGNYSGSQTLSIEF